MFAEWIHSLRYARVFVSHYTLWSPFKESVYGKTNGKNNSMARIFFAAFAVDGWLYVYIVCVKYTNWQQHMAPRRKIKHFPNAHLHVHCSDCDLYFFDWLHTDVSIYEGMKWFSFFEHFNIAWQCEKELCVLPTKNRTATAVCLLASVSLLCINFNYAKLRTASRLCNWLAIQTRFFSFFFFFWLSSVSGVCY